MASWVLNDICRLSDCKVSFPSLIDIKTALEMLKCDAIIPTPALKQLLAEHTGLPADCFTAPSLLKAKAQSGLERQKAQAQFVLEKQKQRGQLVLSKQKESKQ